MPEGCSPTAEYLVGIVLMGSMVYILSTTYSADFSSTMPASKNSVLNRKGSKKSYLFESHHASHSLKLLGKLKKKKEA